MQRCVSFFVAPPPLHRAVRAKRQHSAEFGQSPSIWDDNHVPEPTGEAR